MERNRKRKDIRKWKKGREEKEPWKEIKEERNIRVGRWRVKIGAKCREKGDEGETKG